MRGTRWLLLVAIAVIVSGVGLTYRAQRNALRAHAGPKPAILPDELNSSAQNWTYTESNANHTTVEITAGDAKEARDSSRVDLKNVTLKLHNKHGETYDLVKSAQATYFKNEHRFYSDGDVEITLNIPEAGQSKHPPISIKSSGVNFDTTSGQADTDRASQFIFEHGTGQATGASYDPTTHELRLKQDVKLDWLPVGPHAKPMKIEGASLLYQEASSEIWLRPWGKLTRENTVVEGENADIKLQEDGDGHKSVRSIQADHARGSDVYPNRKLQYAADRLWMSFNEDGKIQAITGETNAQLVETSDASETTVTADHVDLNFDIPEGQESVLTSVTGAGHSTATARPLPVAGRALSETHVLKSDKLEMKMKPGGKEIATVTAPTPATLEFVPNQPVQHHRTLQGKDMLIAYGAQNHIESFHANDARIQTEPTDAEKKRNRTTSVTTSKQIEAHFDPKTNSLVSMQQTGDFTYDEGDRKARAAKATLDSAQSLIFLDTAARMSDPTGSTNADLIRLEEHTGNFTAEGHVVSSRVPEKDQKKNSQMLSGDEPLHAQARKLVSTNSNRTLHYEGNVTMWQGANRIQADVIDVDRREKRSLVADGHVVTNLWEEPKDEQKKKTGTPVMTEVRAPHLVYTEQDRLALYTGGSDLKRPGLHVTAREIRAWLADSGSDSRLEKAFADGSAVIVQTAKDLVRTGSAEHSEFYMADQKVILEGGLPKLVDNKGSNTVGPLGLTYWINDDRLVLNGSEAQPVITRLKKKK